MAGKKKGLWIGSHCTLNRAKLQPELNKALCSWRAIWVAESAREETFKRGHASLPFTLTAKKVSENLRYSTVLNCGDDSQFAKWKKFWEDYVRLNI